MTHAAEAFTKMSKLQVLVGANDQGVFAHLTEDLNQQTVKEDWMKRWKLCVLLCVATSLFLAVSVHDVLAIPAFARRYETSCQTCHIAFPKLNSYGTAFRLLGYRLPDETEELIKQPDTPLGSPGYKRVWPGAVWPASIPGTSHHYPGHSL